MEKEKSTTNDGTAATMSAWSSKRNVRVTHIIHPKLWAAKILPRLSWLQQRASHASDEQETRARTFFITIQHCFLVLKVFIWSHVRGMLEGFLGVGTDMTFMSGR